MNDSPLTRYRDEVASGVLQPDPVQERVMTSLDRVHGDLLRTPVRSAPNARGGLFGGLRRKRPPEPIQVVTGAYLWGGVGRGKTHLMNAFHETLSVPKLRIHFHRFMQRIHGELASIKHTERPLSVIAERLASETRVLCLDEFHVSDIGDAMLLGGLLEALFRNQVALVTTSNVEPDLLYKDGLQRARFVPAIELIKQHTEVIHVDGNDDYRLRALERAEIYHAPLDDDATGSLARSFESLGAENEESGGEIEVLGRPIPTVRRAEGVVWFDFAALCDGPRSASDYIEIARLYHTVFVSNVPIISPPERDRVQRLISLVDEFYDRNVNLIVSAEAAPDALYPEGIKRFEFERTVSRLEEMQSREYLARKHLP